MTKKILSFTVLVLLAFGAASCAKLQARDNLNKGVQAYRAMDYESAIERFKKAIELDPALTNAKLYLATAYSQQFLAGSPSDANQKTADLAVQTFQQVLDKDAANKIAISGIASIYLKTGDFEKARTAYMKNAEVDPQNHIPYYSVGSVDWTIVHNTDSKLTAEEKGKLIEEGLQYLDKALALNPNYEDTLFYENLMYREKASLIDSKIRATKDKAAQMQMETESKELSAKSDEWFNKAMEIRKKNAEKSTVPGGVDPNK